MAEATGDFRNGIYFFKISINDRVRSWLEISMREIIKSKYMMLYEM